MPSCEENSTNYNTPAKEIYIPMDEPIIVDKGVGQLFYDELQDKLDKVAQIDPELGKKETFGELLSRSIKIAQNLRAKGIKQGDVVSMCSYNNLDYTPVFLASFFIGSYSAPMDPTSPLCDFIHLLKLVTPKVLFCDPECESIMEEALRETGLNVDIVVFGGTTDRNVNFSEYLVDQGDEDDFEIYQPADLHETSCMHFSSGTTGLPKAVCVTHYSLCYVGAYVTKNLNMEEIRIVMSVTTPFWISNMTTLILSMINGQARVMTKKFDETTCMKYVQDYKVDCLFLTPVNGNKIFENPEYYNYDLSSLKYFISGGSATSIPQFLDYIKLFPNVTVIDGFGMTELGGLVLQMYEKTEEELKRTNKIVTGTPIPGFRYKLVDPDTEVTCGPHQQGELRLKSECIFNAYYKNLKSYKDSFDSDGFFKTGDIFYYDEELKFYYVTRVKDTFKYLGWHIPPVLIEEQLLKHPNIVQAIVIGIPSLGDGDLVTAVLTVQDKEKFNENEIIQYVADNLPDKYHIRGGVYVIDSFPRTSTGKLQKRKVTEYVLKQQKHAA